MSTLYYFVNGLDVSKEIQAKSMTANDRITDNPDTAFFVMVDPDNEPFPGNTVDIYLDDSSQSIFSGIINSIAIQTKSPGKKIYSISCSDYMRYFDRRLVVEAFATDRTVNQIIQTIVDDYTDPAIGFTTTNVDAPFTLLQPVVFNYRLPSEALRELAETIGWFWYIDKDKDIHFKQQELIFASTELNDSLLKTKANQFKISVDFNQVRNRIFVRGGYNKSNEITENITQPAGARLWRISYKPHDLSLTVNSVVKTVGEENVDSAAAFDYLYNFYEKTLTATGSESTPATGVTIAMTYKFEIPLLARVDSHESQTLIADTEGGDGLYEYVYKDTTLTERAWVFRRADLELQKNAWPRIRGSFVTHDIGFNAGESLVVNVTDNTYNGTYIIQQVTTESLGASNLRYQVEFEGQWHG